MQELSEGYTSEIDNVDENTWYQLIEKFDDANIYQTWAYDTIRCGRENISHLILKKKDTIVSAAQARILKIPGFNIGMAYICWGPLWRLCNAEICPDIFREVIRALRNEYVFKRGLALRISPYLFDNDSQPFLSILREEGYNMLALAQKKRTLLLDLGPSLEDLRKNLRKNWRNHLKQAERSELEIIEGYDDELFDAFISIYEELIDRKKFPRPYDINKYKLMQKELPDKYKMKIFLCRSLGNFCAGIIGSAISKTGITLFRATNETGMKNQAAYLVHWQALEWLKEMQCSIYDLNGINPDKNPGTYEYKTGLCNKNGKDVYFLGQFDSYKNILISSGIKCAEILRLIYSKSKNFKKLL